MQGIVHIAQKNSGNANIPMTLSLPSPLKIRKILYTQISFRKAGMQE
jgi:hypothetical protein